MKNSMKIAVCGIFTALSVVLLFFGGIMVLFIYMMPMITSAFMIMLRQTFGVSSAVITYISTSLISIMLVPERECMLMYVLFFGYYPIIYPVLERIKPRIFRSLLKIIFFNSMLCFIQLTLIYIFGIPLLEKGEGYILLIISFVLFNILFVIYDVVVKLGAVLYKQKLEKRIRKYFK